MPLLNLWCPAGFSSWTDPVHIAHYTAKHSASRVNDGFSGISHHFYTDDIQIYISLKPENSTKDAVRTLRLAAAHFVCAQSCMTQNRLKLNPDKTEFLLIGLVLPQNVSL